MPTTLRRAVNSVALATAVALSAGLGFFYYQKYEEDSQLRDVSSGLRRFEQVLAFHGASKDADVTERGWPLSVEPKWFAGDTPRNLLLTPDRPWLEIATPEEAALANPPLRLAIGSGVAAYWYNPYQGIIRARVPVAISDERTLQTYNRVNGTALDSIYSAEAAPTATPANDGTAPDPKPQDNPSPAPASQASAESARTPDPAPAPHP